MNTRNYSHLIFDKDAKIEIHTRESNASLTNGAEKNRCPHVAQLNETHIFILYKNPLQMDQ